MEDVLAKVYLALVFGILLLSALFLGYQIWLNQQLENNLDKFRSKKTTDKNTYENLFKLGQLYLRKKIYNSSEEALDNADAIFIATPDDNFIRPLEETNKDVILVDLWRYIDNSLSSKFKKYIGYGVCQDDDKHTKKLQHIWHGYE